MADNIQAVGIEFDARDFERALERAMRRLDQLENAFDDTVRASKRQQDAIDSLASRVIALASAYGLFRGAQRAASALFDTNVEFEQLEARLISITGSVEEAAESFDLLTRFAASTPFQVQNLVAAFTQLSAVGLEPTEEMLRDLGNFAAAMGRDITEFVNAVTRAATGETEALKSFGVIARSEGDRLRVTFRGMTHEVQRDFGPVVALFQQLGRANFGDAMERQMVTLAGAISNLEDTTALLAKDIGEAGLNGEITNLVRTLERAITESDDFAEVLGGALASGVRGATEALEAFVAHIDVIQAAFETLLALGIGSAVGNLGSRLAAAVRSAGGLAAALRALAGSGLASLGGPAGLFAAAAVGLALFVDDEPEASAALRSLREEFDALADSVTELSEAELERELADLQRRFAELGPKIRQAREEAGRATAAAFDPKRDRFAAAQVGEERRTAIANVADLEQQVVELAGAITLIEQRLARLRDREAKAAEDSAERQMRALERVLAGLEEQRIELTEGAEAAFRFRLEQEGITGAAQDEAVALFRAVSALQAEADAKKEAEQVEERRRQAIDRTLEALDAEFDALTLSREELIRKTLAAQGATEEEIRQAEERIAAIEEEEKKRRDAEERAREAQAALEAEMQQFQSDADRMAETFGDAFVDIITGTENVADAFHAMVESILRDLARIALREAIVEPLGEALGGLLGGVFGALFGGPFGAAAGAIAGAAAEGANFQPGQRFLVGEEGPEIVEFGRSGQIRPIEVSPVPASVPAPQITVRPRFTLDLSRLPPPRNSIEAARDPEWIRLFAETMREWEKAGGSLARV
ncbi:MAG TPA: hypothetical protein VF188_00480 [Longimicrobiales bacterium]